MLIAIFSDIHGNREAFEACLDDAARLRADRTVLLGDYVGYGADPAWVVERVRGLVAAGAVALAGNHDRALDRGDEAMNPMAQAAIAWTRMRLEASHRAFLASLPLTAEDGERLYVHATAAAPESWDYVTGAAAAERSMRCTPARITLCGHTHVPALYHMAPDKPAVPFRPVTGIGIPLLKQRRWLGVVGAVGQPRDGDPAAAYALFQAETATLTTMRVPYDVETAARKILAAGLPARLAARLHEGR
ncbi:MAG TPA: metallophosphoesterase family protein [Beijerinckiaceae bacterium]|jgi:diadenosine tetraphosphatase ApaH/serine/threonine PP2A family protein phosphatase